MICGRWWKKVAGQRCCKVRQIGACWIENWSQNGGYDEEHTDSKKQAA
jgi:hypothetical protein